MKTFGEFKIGDVVSLKSGGPIMTITTIGHLYGDNEQVHAWCTWFKSKNETHTDNFPIEAIKLADAE